jgi:hypothetical protein
MVEINKNKQTTKSESNKIPNTIAEDHLRHTTKKVFKKQKYDKVHNEIVGMFRRFGAHWE